MILAELTVHHTRRHMPTRRVALGEQYLPMTGAAHGAGLLAAGVAEHARAPDAHPPGGPPRPPRRRPARRAAPAAVRRHPARHHRPAHRVAPPAPDRPARPRPLAPP